MSHELECRWETKWWILDLRNWPWSFSPRFESVLPILRHYRLGGRHTKSKRLAEDILEILRVSKMVVYEASLLVSRVCLVTGFLSFDQHLSLTECDARWESWAGPFYQNRSHSTTLSSTSAGLVVSVWTVGAADTVPGLAWIASKVVSVATSSTAGMSRCFLRRLLFAVTMMMLAAAFCLERGSECFKLRFVCGCIHCLLLDEQGNEVKELYIIRPSFPRELASFPCSMYLFTCFDKLWAATHGRWWGW